MPPISSGTRQSLIAVMERHVRDPMEGFVVWKPVAQEGLARDFPNVTLQTANQIFAAHLKEPNKLVKYKKETRPDWKQDSHFYDLVANCEFGEIYYEFHFHYDPDPDSRSIYIVSCHKQHN